MSRMPVTDHPDPHDATGHDGDEHATLTLSRLLQERPLRDGRLVRDTAADPAVTWCLSWDQALASAEPLDGVVVYCLADRLEETVPRVLRARGAAALVVAGDPPAPVLESAGRGLPVLSVDERVTYREINRLVAELSLARETHVLRYGLTVHRTLAELLYRGAGLAALCHRLARLTDCGVAILDSRRQLLAFAPGRCEELRSDQVAAALHDGLPEVETGPERHGDPEHGPSVGTLRLPGTTVTRIAQPIVLGGRHDGWVALVEPAEPPHPHDIAEHRVVVEQAVMIVGTEMLRIRGIEQAEERARGDFVHALLHGRFGEPHDLAARAVHYDFPVDGCFGVVVAGVPKVAAAANSVGTAFALARDAGSIAPRAGVATLATVVGDVLAVVRQIEPSTQGEPDAGNRALGDYAAALEREFARRSGHPVLVAHGSPVGGAGRIYDSYREARITLALRQRLGLPDVCGFQDLRVYATLADLATSAQGRAFAADLLTPLRTTRTGTGDLEKSVLAYISAGGNVNAAARELHVHRNTMLYKLERASHALHLDLRRAEHRFAFWLAYKLDLLAETTATVDRDVRPI